MSERTLVVLKPDALGRRLVGRIIAKYEDAGFGLLALKLVKQREVTGLVGRHYPDTMAEALGVKAREAGQTVLDLVSAGKNVLGWCRSYLASGPQTRSGALSARTR